MAPIILSSYSQKNILETVIQYLELGLNIIPVSRNKTPLVPWKEYQNRMATPEEVQTWWSRWPDANIGIVTGKISGIVVVDLDSPDAIQWVREKGLFENTPVVRTKKGLHVYYAHPGYEIKNSVNVAGKRIDIRADGGYVVAPPSEINGHIYTWLQEFDRSKLVPFPQILLENVSGVSGNSRTINSEGQHLSQEQIEQIADILTDVYQPGMRQQVCLALSGILRKSGFAVEDAIALISYLHAIHHDEDPIQQRISAATYTWAKPDDQIAAWSLLNEINEDVADRIAQILMPPEETEDEDIIKDSVVIDGQMFIADDMYWYAVEDVSETGKPLATKMVCRYFTVPTQYIRENSQEVEFMIDVGGRICTLPQVDLTQLEKILGRFIVAPAKARLIFNALSQRAPQKLLFTRTGWYNNIFLHPLIAYENIQVNLGKYQKYFVSKNIHEQHEFIKNVLREGKLLAVKIAFAVSSLFVDTGFTVLDVGPRGVGKTITSSLACSVFYDSEIPNTAYKTKTAAELHLATFCNMPLLMDEVAMSYDDQIQALIFMVFAGKGKSRGTVKLTVEEKDLRSVLFLTNERELALDRQGAYRRMIVLHANSITDYTYIDLPTLIHSLSTYCGCGVEYIRYLLQHPIERYDRFLKDFEALKFTHAVEKAVQMLENYYALELYNLKSSIYLTFERQYAEATRDIFDIFWEKFTEWISANYTSFIRIQPSRNAQNREPVIVPNQARPCFGLWDETQQVVYVMCQAFKRWCIDENLPLKTCLMTAREKKRLLIPDRVGVDGYRLVKHIPHINTKASVYCFRLS